MKNIRYEISNAPCKEVVKLISTTIYGTKGLRLSHKNAERKVQELYCPDFHALWEEGELLAVAVYSKRDSQLGSEKIDTYYIRFFSVAQSAQNKGVGKLLTEKLEEYYRKNIKNKSVFYAYIENKNFRSVGVSKHFEPKKIGSLSIVFFSRFFPKKNANCFKATEGDLKSVREKLKVQYKNHVFSFFNRIGYDDLYYVYKEEGEVIAGVQFLKTKWRIHSLPGLMGWMTLNFFSKIPVLNKIADGKNVSFAGVEGVYCKSGRMDELMILLEHALAASGQNKAFIYFDGKDELYQKIKARKDLGFMNKIQKAPSVRIIRMSVNLDEKDEDLLSSGLKYISAYDAI